MKNFLRWFTVFGLFGLAACSGGGGGVDVEPAELKNIKAKLQTPVIWKQSIDFTTPAETTLEPLHNGNRLFVASEDGRVAAYSLKNGNRRWQVDLEFRISSSMGGDGKRLIIGGREGEVVVLQQQDGKRLWRQSVSSEVLSRPMLMRNVAILRTNDGKLYGLHADTGNPLWVYERKVPPLSLHGASSPFGDERWIYAGFDNGKLVAFSALDGKVMWEVTLAVPSGRSELERMVDIDADPVLRDGIIYAVSFQGRLAAISATTGSIAWFREMSAYAGLTVDNHNVYVTDANSHVLALDRQNGSTFWKQTDLFARQLTTPVLHDTYIVVGDYEGYLHWLSREDGSIVGRARVDETPIKKTPLVVGDTLYAISQGGVFASYKLKPVKKK